jgi:hypothetical protein
MVPLTSVKPEGKPLVIDQVYGVAPPLAVVLVNINRSLF